MTDINVMEQYSKAVKNLKNECMNEGISEEEFQQMYSESLDNLNEINLVQKNVRTVRNYKKTLKFSVIFIIVLLILSNYKTMYSSFICHMQDYIYPGLRLLRKVAIPFISLFPALTDLYQETCLIQNPFFTVVDMDCWPCNMVNNIGEIFNPQPIHMQQNAPFIYKTEQVKVDFNMLQHLYNKNRGIFDKESPNILVNNKYYCTPQDIFKPDHEADRNVFIWKLNNFNVARILRQIIPRPKVVPKFGQSTERFIIIDSSQNTFKIPDTECNYSFLLGLSGSRVIQLKPAEECKHQCKSFRLELKESYLLWYNWWYWRPMVYESSGNETFIAHVGSYC